MSEDNINIKSLTFYEKNKEKLKEYHREYRKKKKLENEKFKSSKVERLQQFYYFIDRDLLVESQLELNSSLDDNLHNCFNYFTDKEKAEKYAEYMKLQLELFQIRDKIRNGWEPDWDSYTQVKYYVDYFNSKIEYVTAYGRPKQFAFKSLSQCKKFVKSVEKEKLIKYFKF